MKPVKKPYRATRIQTWGGDLYSKRALKLLMPGCIVRVCLYEVSWGNGYVQTTNYYKIVKIKDGTIWGEMQDIYCLPYGSLPIGAIVPFRYNNVSEIPISWQPKRIRRKLKNCISKTY